MPQRIDTLAFDWAEHEQALGLLDAPAEARNMARFCFYSGAMRITRKLMNCRREDTGEVVLFDVERANGFIKEMNDYHRGLFLDLLDRPDAKEN